MNGITDELRDNFCLYNLFFLKKLSGVKIMFSSIIQGFFTVFMLQGHMYLFVHYVCFYSNIFGFETKVMFEHQLYFFYRGLCLSWFLFSFLTVS